jgi:hypothetical protein
MRQTYRVLAGLIALGVVAQAAFVALGWFIALHDLDDGKVLTEDYDGNVGHALHSVFGSLVIPLLAIILFVISFFAKIDGGVKWAGYVLLAVILQIVLAFVSFGVPAIGALHGINAFVVAGLAGGAARLAAGAPSMEPSTPVSA